MSDEKTPTPRPSPPNGRAGDAAVTSRARRMDRQRSYHLNGPGCMVPITVGGVVGVVALLRRAARPG